MTPIRLKLPRSQRRSDTRTAGIALIERVETLESRLLLATTVTGRFGVTPTSYIHDVTLNIDNSVNGLSIATFNQSSLNTTTNTVPVSFSGKIEGPTEVGANYAFHDKELDIVVTYVNAGVPGSATATVANTKTVTQFQQLANDTNPVRSVAGFATSVNLPAGDYTATLSAVFKELSTVDDSELGRLTPISNVTIDVNTKDIPTITGVGPVPTVASNTPVDSINFTTNEPITSAIDYHALTLTRDGNALPLTSAVQVTAKGPTAYTVSGLTGFTGTSGRYVLTVSAAGLLDSANNPGTGSTASQPFDVKIDGPAVKSIGPSTTPRNTPVDTVGVTFASAVEPTSFDYHALTLKLNGANVPLNSSVTVAPVAGSTTSFTVSGLGAFTAAQGDYLLTVNGGSVTAPLPNPNVGSGSVSDSFTVDTTRPVVTSIGPVPDGAASFDSVPVVLSKPINPSTFDYRALTLTRNGQNVPLDGTVTAAPDSGPGSTAYTITGLTAFTRTTGNYVLTVSAAGFTDPAGNAGNGSAQAGFVLNIPGPVVTGIGGQTTPRNSPVDSVPVTFATAVAPSSFDYHALTLTRGGANVPLNSSVIVSPAAGSSTSFTVSGLSAFTAAQGDYVLTVDGGSVTDPFANLGSGSVATSFLVDTTPPAVVSVGPVPDGAASFDSVPVVLSKPINPSTFDYRALTLTRNGQNVPLDGTVTVAPDSGPGSTAYTITGLTAFTRTTGNYVLTVSAARLTDPVTNQGTGSAKATFALNIPGPVVTRIGQVTTPRPTPVDTVSVTFASAVAPSSFDYHALTLTRGGANVPLNSSVIVSPAAGSSTSFTVSGLSAFTAAQGDYVLTVDGGSVTDPFANLGSGTARINFSLDTTVPTIASVGPVSGGNQPIDSVPVVLSKPIVPATFDFRALTLTRNGQNVPLPDPSDPTKSAVTVVENSDATPTAYTISGLTGFTRSTGHYVLTVSAAHVVDPVGNPGAGSSQTAFDLNIAGPAITSVGPVTTPLNKPVGPVTLTFASAVDPSSFDVRALTLTRDKVNVPLDNSVTVSPVNGSASSVNVNGLQSFTKAQGDYVLTVNGAALKDPSGNLGNGAAHTEFVEDTTRPGLLSVTSAATNTVPLDTVTVVLNKPITSNTFNVRALTLTRNGQPVPLGDPNSTLVTATVETATPTVFTVSGLGAYTKFSGTYVLTVSAAGFTDQAGNTGTGTATTTFRVKIAPSTTVAGLTPVPSPRTLPVTLVSGTISAPINPSTFDYHDLTLTRNGNNVALNAGLKVASAVNASGSTSFLLSGLGAFTRAPGSYVLTVNGLGITDASGNPVTNSNSVTFTVLAGPPANARPPQVLGPKTVVLPAQVVLTFDQPMNPDTVGLPGNYAIYPVVQGRVQSRLRIAVKSAAYHPSSRTVTLTPASTLNLHNAYVLVANGSRPLGINNLYGMPLSGNSGSKPGAPYVLTI